MCRPSMRLRPTSRIETVQQVLGHGELHVMHFLKCYQTGCERFFQGNLELFRLVLSMNSHYKILFYGIRYAVYYQSQDD